MIGNIEMEIFAEIYKNKNLYNKLPWTEIFKETIHNTKISLMIIKEHNINFDIDIFKKLIRYGCVELIEYLINKSCEIFSKFILYFQHIHNISYCDNLDENNIKYIINLILNCKFYKGDAIICLVKNCKCSKDVHNIWHLKIKYDILKYIIENNKDTIKNIGLIPILTKYIVNSADRLNDKFSNIKYPSNNMKVLNIFDFANFIRNNLPYSMKYECLNLIIDNLNKKEYYIYAEFINAKYSLRSKNNISKNTKEKINYSTLLEKDYNFENIDNSIYKNIEELCNFIISNNIDNIILDLLENSPNIDYVLKFIKKYIKLCKNQNREYSMEWRKLFADRKECNFNKNEKIIKLLLKYDLLGSADTLYSIMKTHIEKYNIINNCCILHILCYTDIDVIKNLKIYEFFNHLFTFHIIKKIHTYAHRAVIKHKKNVVNNIEKILFTIDITAYDIKYFITTHHFTDLFIEHITSKTDITDSIDFIKCIIHYGTKEMLYHLVFLGFKLNIPFLLSHTPDDYTLEDIKYLFDNGYKYKNATKIISRRIDICDYETIEYLLSKGCNGMLSGSDFNILCKKNKFNLLQKMINNGMKFRIIKNSYVLFNNEYIFDFIVKNKVDLNIQKYTTELFKNVNKKIILSQNKVNYLMNFKEFRKYLSDDILIQKSHTLLKKYLYLKEFLINDVSKNIFTLMMEIN